jgi:hypothetical protein
MFLDPSLKVSLLLGQLLILNFELRVGLDFLFKKLALLALCFQSFLQLFFPFLHGTKLDVALDLLFTEFRNLIAITVYFLAE